MKQHSKNKARYFLPLKTIIVMAVILSVIVITTSAYKTKDNIISNNAKYNIINADSVESVEAFMQVYKVLMSPRCMNCHPSGDRPLQGDDSHIHIMNVQRGKDGKGIYALKCSNCHQPDKYSGLTYASGQSKMAIATGRYENGFPGKKCT